MFSLFWWKVYQERLRLFWLISECRNQRQSATMNPQDMLKKPWSRNWSLNLSFAELSYFRVSSKTAKTTIAPILLLHGLTGLGCIQSTYSKITQRIPCWRDLRLKSWHSLVRLALQLIFCQINVSRIINSYSRIARRMQILILSSADPTRSTPTSIFSRGDLLFRKLWNQLCSRPGIPNSFSLCKHLGWKLNRRVS